MISGVISIYVANLYDTPFSEIVIVFFSLFRMVPIIAQIIQGKTSIAVFLPAYEQMRSLREKAARVVSSNTGKKFQKLETSLDFKNVTFSYKNRDPALSNVNIKIKRGKMTALIGDSGAGKTTIVDLILGLYKPSDGIIKIDQNMLDDYSITSFRNSIGYVPQDPQLFNISIRENLLWANKNANRDDIIEACRLANATDFINQLPQKLDSSLGDRGIRVSGGQRQRLALARALVRKPEILILDEATSSLDLESEKLIQESIDNLAGDITIIVIAHRLSTIKNSDYIYYMRKGKVVEEGEYDKLIELGDSNLSKMVMRQT